MEADADYLYFILSDQSLDTVVKPKLNESCLHELIDVSACSDNFISDGKISFQGRLIISSILAVHSMRVSLYIAGALYIVAPLVKDGLC